MREYPKQTSPRDRLEQRRHASAEALERRQQIRALILLALAALLFSILRAGAGRVFTTGWMRLW